MGFDRGSVLRIPEKPAVLAELDFDAPGPSGILGLDPGVVAGLQLDQDDLPRVAIHPHKIDATDSPFPVFLTDGILELGVDEKAIAALRVQLVGDAHQEWIKFLKQIDVETPADLDLHLIVDNYATHKHPNVKTWLKSHPRFHIHFIPTGSSWLNVVERFFRDLDDKRIHRGVFRSVPQLIGAIMDYIEQHNVDPRPFVWKKTADEIIEKVGRARLALDNAPTD